MHCQFIVKIDSLASIRDVNELYIANDEKRMIITMVLAGIHGMANAQNTSSTEGHTQSATAISRVLGDGRKVETVVLQYDTPIRNKSLSTESFKVEGKM